MPTQFNYDPQELRHLGPLLRPVYFNKQVLTRYLYDKRFQCVFAGGTYATLYADEWHISLGLNRHGSVIAWLGDLQGLPDAEQNLWLTENIPSQHDIASEFYDAQIEIEFSEPPPALKALRAIRGLNSKACLTLGFHLYDPAALDDPNKDVNRYNRIILGNLDDFARFLTELSGMVTETTNNTDIRAHLTAKGVAFDKGMKGNKLLELLYVNVLRDTNNLIAPFFYLYDLRLWAAHNMGDAGMLQVAANLNVDPEDYQKLFERLLEELRKSAAALQALL